ncbi:MAG: LysR family transcriptional regulator, partial [Paracoccaceae bacterium]|nr:LysR family transcriptional regulator [Paracoccaceae bacterium]
MKSCTGLSPCRKPSYVRQLHNSQGHHEDHHIMHIEFRHLRTIKAIHEAGGLGRAADLLN